MTSKLRFNTVDVFTQKLFEGNQLAIVHVPSGTTLTGEKELHIAVEYNLSETVFLDESSDKGKYNARIYTTKSEIPFAGHPTIGTLCWIFTNLATDRDEISLQLKAGEVKAKFDRKTNSAVAEIPQDARVHSTRFPWSRVEWSQPSLAAAKKKDQVPVVSAVKGLNFAVIDLSFQPDLLAKVTATDKDIPTAEDLDEGWPPTVMGNVYFYLKPDEGDGVIRVQQRVMVLSLEDPATGSASAALASYLSLQRGGAGQTYKYELEQGTEMGRKSLIGVTVALTGDGKGIHKVYLSGSSVEVLEGTLRIQ